MAFDEPLLIEQLPGSSAGTLIYRLSGPVTLRNLFDLQGKLRAGDPPPVTILDLGGVPYMDSAGMGAVINHYVRCHNKGTRLIVASVSPRVMELFKLTKVHSVIALAVSVEAAEAIL
jgi:anti-sigma B factor antagonist